MRKMKVIFISILMYLGLIVDGFANMCKKSDCIDLASKHSVFEIDGKGISVILGYIFLSFIGGLCLNLMPCVLPILSIKAGMIRKLSRLDDIRVMKANLFGSFCGIMVFFAVIGCVIWYFKSIGRVYLWGGYFQSEISIGLAIIGLFYVFGMSLNQRVYSMKGGSSDKWFFISGVISGVTSTLLSTPCFGPFMGSMVAIAIFEKSIIISWIIILSIGFSLGFPYLMMGLMRDARCILPKSGAWMRYISFMGNMVMFMTMLWLVYLLCKKPYGLLFLPFILVVTSIVFYMAKSSESVIKSIIWLMMGIFVVISGMSIFKGVLEYKYGKIVKPEAIDFNVEKLEKYVFKGKTVMVRFTADWCVTCKIMDVLLFDSDEIGRMIGENDVVYMVADITNGSSKEVEDFMAENKIVGIPAIYIASSSEPGGSVYSGILKKSEMINIIAKNI
ncbi:cytochrome c biogenesis protein CcdA [Candidatus Deianiraea vastatrix]|uniref:DsbD-like thiol:disulfide interchange protein n=1 Tax=Candidatus Deianiraea vastatrix TaxID=2163644 RepID=A0A5B8XI58_9RICK|nr:cytochrome c biogenesis protein CcdA [Candidatus Deianiraea vastatrix]QED23711.1 Putative DsbD-like thiol:disulfide interchange protein precursor [Candidatus Deianiraea vastatrix]